MHMFDTLVDALLTADLLPLLFAAGLLVLLARSAVPDGEHPRHLGRLVAAAVFVVYLLALFDERLPVVDEGIGGVLRGLALAGIASSVAGLVLAITGGLRRRIVGGLGGVHRVLTRQHRAASHAHAQQAEQAAREQQERVGRQRTQEDPRLRAEARRREDARARVEILFHLNMPEMGSRFPREIFDDFVARYMGDGKDPEYVEARAEQLAEVIRQHLDRVRPLRPGTIDEILAAYASRRQKIEQATLDDRDKQVLLIQLDQRREQDVTEAIAEGRL
jgi:hypothetical protein